ncbi:MAG: outer membrane protein assembly factor BamE [Neisseria sp.]|nr:outer membrane protein assembly factor BamE [Neisseria sp.]
MNFKTSTLILLAALGLSACSAERFSYFPSYKLKVIQGNQLDARAVLSLKQGMSRDQVQLLLGTPLLRDPFQPNRWDYVYEISRNGIVEKEQSRQLTVWFQDDKVVSAEGNAFEYAREQLAKEQAQSK